ncbi:PepSY-associated TM helix domain-containing protein, partial [Pyxidicoccus sp. 3LG]
DELVARVRAARPDAQPSGVTVYSEPGSAVMVNLGREALVYVNPYTGEVKDGGAQGWRDFFHVMEDLHRWLAAHGDSRAIGKGITGASNAVFLFLALSGLYLWWPRKWTLRAMRPSLWFRRGLKGKARDWNWHNVIGFWSLPVLIVLTASGMVISYRWASDLVFKVTGNTPPASNQGPPGQSAVKLPAPPPGTERLKLDALFAEARKGTPEWASGLAAA